MATLLGYHNLFLQHRTGRHPERPARLTAIIETLKHENLWSHLKSVTGDDIDPDPWILTNHSQEYVNRLQQACQNQLPFIDSPDSAICPDSYRVAQKAVAVTLDACDIIIGQQAQNGFCALRPPGHHAEYDRSLGFCLFNNVAIAGRYLQQKHNIKKILIFDSDVHHGNGTQHSFERDNTVFYCSLHQHPATLYPGTGWPQEVGEGPGRGFTLNLPLEPGAGDDECLEMFRVNFLPVAREFNPDFVLISAGFDGHRKDPLSQLNMSDIAYDEMTKDMITLAQNCCQGRLLTLLEGGYHLGVLGHCVSNHIKLLMNYTIA
ncbi:MAG: histone deacetylase [Sedimentisphaerales bacterium]|nr:histone deacetylase [Sedimentisphaerales bacterium]